MKAIHTLLTVALTVFLISCGGEEKKEKKSIKLGAKTEKRAAVKGLNLALTGNDLMQFDKKELRAKAGEEVTLTLRHVGKIDVKVMGHNFVLLKQGTSIPSFAAKAAAVGQSASWIPDGGKEVIAHTKMIGGGQTTTVTFTAPSAGTYDYICSFPGHSGLMKGKFIVE